ncbi:isoaspartyl peptidase/L-asparaginase family protein [Sphingomonas arenae]|uniref:isoaspartyl peptidase/L-asparaginase family protein n=1 Tax=Sphingomonas arenae TaxID=2812555 RepID=UPI00196877A1|nr:isoaspartyl peptidase/L-asparaginase family protein [Sphingomonas arenae]
MADAEGRWALIVHGGAKKIEPGEEQANREGVIQAAEAGRSVLANGGSAVEAVEAAIKVLEDLPVFNAGRGSVLNAVGWVEMCSGIMDGGDRSVGAVAALRDVRHPIEVARLLLPEREVLLAGEGARMFAQERGVELASDEQLKAEEPYGSEQEHDTVGAVAIDQLGRIAAGTSTGGLDGTKAGRVGDSPLPGCGYYADDRIGGVALSGDGETITRLTIASAIMGRLEAGEQPDAAIAAAVAELPEVGGADADAGAIAITHDGRIGWHHNSPDFAVALIDSSMNGPRAWLRKTKDKDQHD